MISLEKASLLQVDPISQKNTLRLLPVGKNNKQKVIVGDDSGYLRSYDFNKGEPINVFSTKVFDGPISCVALGGANPLRHDKIFVAHRQQLSGITKKGKEFFTLSSSLSENISTIWVENTLIWTGCECICNQYDDGKDVAFFMGRGTINCMVVDYVAHAEVFDAILGCEDNTIRFMNGTDLTTEVLTTGPVTALAALRKAPVQERPPMIVYGVEGGSITCLRFTDNQLDGRSVRPPLSPSRQGQEPELLGEEEHVECWTIPDGKVNKSSVSCITITDLTCDGKEELVVAREDGRVEVYAQIDVTDGVKSGLHLNRPQLVFSSDIGEKVQSLVVGRVNSTTYKEIVVATYSGKVVSFTTEPILSGPAADGVASTMGEFISGGSSSVSRKPVAEVNDDNRIKSLHKEIEGLQGKIEKAKAKVRKMDTVDSPITGMPFSSPTAGGGGRGAAIATGAEFSSTAKFALDRDVGLYMLSVEIQCPLDVVIVRSPVKLEVVENDMTTSLASVTPDHLLDPLSEDDVPGSDPCRFIAAVRAQTGEKRTKIALRPREGDHGDITVSIVTATTPKMAKSLRFNLKPLSLHHTCHVVTDEEKARPRCSIKLTGDFSVNTAFEWVQSVLPDMSFSLTEDAASEVIYFKSSYSGAVAKARLERNTIIFESQSASVVATFKEAVTRQATFRRTTLNETASVPAAAVEAFLELFLPSLRYQMSLTSKFNVLDAVKEITHAEGAQEGEAPAWLTEEYREVHRNSAKLRSEFKEKGRVLDYLAGLVVALHVDFLRLHGQQARAVPEKVREAVLSGQLDNIVQLVMGDVGTYERNSMSSSSLPQSGSNSNSNSNSIRRDRRNSGGGGGGGRWQPGEDEVVDDDDALYHK